MTDRARAIAFKDHPDPAATSGTSPIDWGARAMAFTTSMTEDRGSELACALSITTDSLDAIGVGWDGAAWTFPEHALDPESRKWIVVGLSRRFPNGDKKFHAGGKRGLTIPKDLGSRRTPVLAVEGASDVLAALSRGIDAIGRPSDTGKREQLAEALRALCLNNVIILAENDRKEDGTWPGRDGAMATAQAVGATLGMPVPVAFPPGPHKDLREWLASEPNLDGAEVLQRLRQTQQLVAAERNTCAVTEEPTPTTSTPDWPTLSSLKSHINVPDFPIETALPPALDELREYYRAVATQMQVPVDLVVMLGIAILAASSASRYEVQPRHGWREVLALWTLILLSSGNRKSATLTILLKPLQEWEREEAERLAPEIAAATEKRLIMEKRLEEMRRGIARGKASAPEDKDAIKLATEIAMTQIPTMPRGYTSEPTTEALRDILVNNQEHALVVSTEADALDVMCGRYSSNGKGTFGIWLVGHSGDAHRVDRKSGAAYLNRPVLSVALSVQAESVEDLFQDRQARGRGLLGRFLYAIPRSMLGHRDTDPPPVPEHLTHAYHALIRRMLSTPVDPAGARIMEISAAANSLLTQLEETVEPELAEDGDLGDRTDWGGKLVGAVVRIAAVLEIASSACCAGSAGDVPTVGAEAMKAALSWVPYLVDQQRAAFQLVGADPVLVHARRLVGWIKRQQLPRLTRRDAFNVCRNQSIRKVEDVDPILEVLIEAAYIRPAPQPPPGPGRPPSPAFDVNPLVYRDGSAS